MVFFFFYGITFDVTTLTFNAVWQYAREDVPRAVEFRRRSRCDGQAVRTIAASLVAAGASTG